MPRILGLHHLTATVGEAQPDLDFHVGLLGLRLVKRTVNFDNHAVHHFYYGDGAGSPSTLMTTFPYARQGLREGVQGAGQVTVTRFSVPGGALVHWRRRLDAAGVASGLLEGVAGSALRFQDPSGLAVELVEAVDDPRAPWKGGGVPPVEVGTEIRGLHSVVMTVRDPDASASFAAAMLGMEEVARGEGWVRVRAPTEGAGHPARGNPGRILDIVRAPDHLPDAVNGTGTVHHVALAVTDDEAQQLLRAHLVEAGVQVTPVRDRKYFRSIYFREPGGVLYEVATMGPGFAVDESPGALGEALRLPDDVTDDPADVERRLDPVRVPGTRQGS